MKYSQIPESTFQELQLNAGVLMDSFDVETEEIGTLLGATTGGINFTDTPTFTDYGEDIDNCPKNTKELKRIDSREVKMSATFVTITAAQAKSAMGAADVAADGIQVVPRDELKTTDFKDIWWVGDYGDVDGGFVAVHMMNALSTAGLQIQTSDKAKGNFAVEYTAHYSIDSQTTVPYEIYIKKGSTNE